MLLLQSMQSKNGLLESLYDSAEFARPWPDLSTNFSGAPVYVFVETPCAVAM